MGQTKRGEVWRTFLVRELGLEGNVRKEIAVPTPEEAVDLIHVLYEILEPGVPGTLVIEYQEVNSNQQQRVFFNPGGMGIRAEDWRSFLDRRNLKKMIGEGTDESR